MGKLEDFLAGKPLNEDMERLMQGEESADELGGPGSLIHRSFADGKPITEHDREDLRQLSQMRGWQVLLKLLDTELQHQEDSAKRSSLDNPLKRQTEIAEMWAELAADQKSRTRLVLLLERELRAIEAAKVNRRKKKQ